MLRLVEVVSCCILIPHLPLSLSLSLLLLLPLSLLLSLLLLLLIMRMLIGVLLLLLRHPVLQGGVNPCLAIMMYLSMALRAGGNGREGCE